MTHDVPALVRIAQAERLRRKQAWRDMIGQRKVSQARVDADNALWQDIEVLMRIHAGDPKVSIYYYPSDLPALARTARTTLKTACAAIGAEDPEGCRKIRDLWRLTRFLETAAGYSSAIPNEVAVGKAA
ncbi:MAG TPA: hypothetical protein VIR65_14910 [Rhizorhapis sp.]